MSEEIKSYKDLLVWQEAMELVVTVYELAGKLPGRETFGICQQICRAAVSIPANIAEGHGSSHRKVFLNHLSVARGSLMEVRTYIELIERVGFAKDEEVEPLEDKIEQVSKLLSGLIRSLKGREQGSGVRGQGSGIRD
jgi:four helix bundle protein